MLEVRVHPRICENHPELSQSDVLEAWENILHSKTRLDEEPYKCIAVGMDNTGRLLEMVAVRSRDGSLFIFHAMTPPSKKTLKELELSGGRRETWGS